MTNLVFGPWDRKDFHSRYCEVCFIVDTMDEYGYFIEEEDAYKAWLNGGSGVWDSPAHYTPEEIIVSVLAECSVVEDDDDDDGQPPFPVPVPVFVQEIEERQARTADDVMEEILEVVDYKPKRFLHLEGEIYDNGVWVGAEASVKDSASAFGEARLN